jgi:hypothetical protein
MNDQISAIRNIESIRLNSNGTIVPRSCDPGENNAIENTLFGVLFPDGQIACLSTAWANANAVDQLRHGVSYGGRRLLAIGSRKSKRSEKLYLVDEVTHSAIVARFGNCGEALISFFDLLLLPCQSFRQEKGLRIALMSQTIPGRRDWCASIRRSLFDKFEMPNNRGLHFAMAFAGTQSAGELNVMEDNYADRFGVDILLPKRSVKPLPEPDPGTLVGDVLLGIGDTQEPEGRADSDVLLTLFHEHVCSPRCNATFSTVLNDLLAPKLRPAVTTFAAPRVRLLIDHSVT